MRIFLYEFVTGGGWHSEASAAPPAALAAEGRAMLSAVAADLAALEAVSLDVLCDTRCEPLDLPGCSTHRVGSAAVSGTCVDGYCCNGRCTGVCDRCNRSVMLGMCVAAAAGSAPTSPGCGVYLCNGSSAACPTSSKKA